MGTMTFQLPPGMSRDALRELERTCMAGGPDNMPWPTDLQQSAHRLSLHRAVDESGYLVVPWPIEGFGHLMSTSATLMERSAPYHLVVELARGKVNQVRNQAADWCSGGLQVSEPLQKQIQQASQAFGLAVTGGGTPEEVSRLAQSALTQGFQAADHLVQTYVDQVFAIRHQRQPRLETALACRLGSTVPLEPARAALVSACNTVGVPMAWHTIETEEASYRWEHCDALVSWAQEQELDVCGGPLIDFSSSQLPAWLWLWERDLPSLAAFMCKFVETVVRRYRTRIRRWQLTTGSNWANVLALTEEELLGLTYRLAEAARQVDSSLEITIGIAQPWGEYMALADRTHSPFIFADTLIRSGINLAALDVEVVMGLSPRGSYCRDLLETSRLLDLYALLGVPISVTLGYPSSPEPDRDADPELRVAAGHWGDGFTLETQARWARTFAALAVCKPFVQSVQWVHCSDAEPHQFPHCGLVDSQGQPKPALEQLRLLREEHLR